MSTFLRKLLCLSFVKAVLIGQIRHYVAMAGAGVVVWLVSKHADPTQANETIQYGIGFVMSAIGLGWSMLDKNNVADRLTATAAVGAVVSAPDAKTLIESGVIAQHDADHAQADKVKAAIAAADAAAPQDKAALLADLIGAKP